mgnify:CR=1 FL=1
MKILLKTCCFILISSLNLLEATTAYFTPPESWKEVDPKHLSPLVQMGYVGKGKEGFSPSINIAKEPIDQMSQKEYLQIVKKLHKDHPGTSWRHLGSLQTQSGKADLTEITVENHLGTVKLLQCIIAKNGYAHILTGASSSKEFGKFRQIFTQSFRSFAVVQDLMEAIQNPAKKTAVQQKLLSLKQLLKSSISAKEKEKAALGFHQYLVDECKEQGKYWQYLMIKQLQN